MAQSAVTPQTNRSAPNVPMLDTSVSTNALTVLLPAPSVASAVSEYAPLPTVVVSQSTENGSLVAVSISCGPSPASKKKLTCDTPVGVSMPPCGSLAVADSETVPDSRPTTASRATTGGELSFNNVLSTVTVTACAVPTLPLSSSASTVMTRAPSATVLVSQPTAYSSPSAVVSVPMSVPSTKKRTAVMVNASVASARMTRLPATASFCAGEVIATDGGVRSRLAGDTVMVGAWASVTSRLNT